MRFAWANRPWFAGYRVRVVPFERRLEHKVHASFHAVIV